jgi:pyruvate formate lyase activating enzyme
VTATAATGPVTARPTAPATALGGLKAVGSVHSFDISIGVDGPGTRFVAFLAGCPLRCQYCHSPDTWYRGNEADDDLLAATDLVLLDIKSGREATYRKVTRTGDLAPTVRFAHRLAERGVPIWVRFVLVPGLTDDPANVDAVAAIAAGVPTVERVEVLPFHRLGAAKYAALGLPFPLAGTPVPDTELLHRVQRQFQDHGIDAYV